MPSPKLSVLDLVPVRTDQTTGDALAATVELARTAERLGFTRYWLAEHHNMPAVAASSPPVLIAHVAAHTERIRVGSGGVMLPNHAPLAVAEQFALLEAAHPGRIDLGIGRAPGSDQVTSWALRGAAGRDNTDIEQFPQYLDDVMALMDSSVGVRVPVGGRQYLLKATPVATSTPRQWLLGSSMYSAHLAAAKGLPYVFAHHFSGQGTAEALATYRAEFQPSAHTPEPTTFLTVNAVVAQTYEEAVALALPNLQSMARLRTGAPLAPLDLVEDAEKVEMTGPQLAMVEEGLLRNVVGDPSQAAERIRALAAQFDVDEVMISPNASAHQGDDPRRSSSRERTLELLADALA
ncbi:LLM class flavin-dependent oxidoreductase [Mumia sp. Pv 4-285]|uniref:LLM class flavin-dependent oxidoreductase n=1 Tax=Mumia qirimensis TaxID=3234852 RepID=UPI00351D00DD